MPINRAEILRKKRAEMSNKKKLFVPFPEKDNVRKLGGVWNKISNQWEGDPEKCKDYLPSNFEKIPLKDDIPFELRKELKEEIGVVTVKEGEEWSYYVMKGDDLGDLLLFLDDLGVLC